MTADPLARDLLVGGATEPGAGLLHSFVDQVAGPHEQFGPRGLGLSPFERFLEPLPAERFVGALSMVRPLGLGYGRIAGPDMPAVALPPEAIDELGPPDARPLAVLEDVAISARHMPAAAAAIRVAVNSPEPARMAPSLAPQPTLSEALAPDSAPPRHLPAAALPGPRAPGLTTHPATIGPAPSPRVAWLRLPEPDMAVVSAPPVADEPPPSEVAAPTRAIAPALFRQPLLPPLAVQAQRRRQAGSTAAATTGGRRQGGAHGPPAPSFDARRLVAQLASLTAAGPGRSGRRAELRRIVAGVGGSISHTLMRLPAAAPGVATALEAGTLAQIRRLASPIHAGIAGEVVATPPDAPAAIAQPAGDAAEAPEQAAAVPPYFRLPPIAADVARRLSRSTEGRRLVASLERGGPSRRPGLPQGALRAIALGDRAPPGGVPKAGGTGSAGPVAELDVQLMAAMDQWEAAFPGRTPYVTPTEGGEGNEEPDFKHAAPTGRRTAAAPRPSDEAIMGDLMRELGLNTPRGGAARDRPPLQGGDDDWAMALVRPIMQVVEEVSEPLHRETVEDGPGSGIAATEKGIEDADTEKVQYVANQILIRLRLLVDAEQDRRGY